MKMQYYEECDYNRRKSILSELHIKELVEMIMESSNQKYPPEELKEDLIELILQRDLDLE